VGLRENKAAGGGCRVTDVTRSDYPVGSGPTTLLLGGVHHSRFHTHCYVSPRAIEPQRGSPIVGGARTGVATVKWGYIGVN